MTNTVRNLRVLTWNIHGCVGRDGRRDLKRIGNWVTTLNPDIAALQEVDTRHKVEGYPAVDEYLREQVGDHGHLAWSISGADGHYGQIVASRFPLVDRHVHDISVRGREPRKIIEARANLPAAPLRVIATHLGLQFRERREQMARLREIVLADLSLPILLLGDFNEWRWRHNAVADIFGASAKHASFPSRFPVFALDRIHCRPQNLLASSRAVSEAHMASDHLPIVADLSLPAAIDLTDRPSQPIPPR